MRSTLGDCARRRYYDKRKVIHMVYANKRAARLLSLLLALMMIFTVCGTGVLAESAEGGTESSTTESNAAETTNVPDPSANFYIHDEENILSTETKNEILTRNGTLYEKYGIQICVLTMKAIPGDDINEKGNYLHQVIDSWQVGGTSEKCLMLMLSVTEQNYVAVAGDGLSSEFPVETWSALFTQYLEPDFAAAQYDAGVLKFFNAIADKAELYAVNTSMTASEPAATPTAEPSAEPEKEETEGSGFGKVLRVFGILIFIVLVILIIGFIVIYVHGQMVRKKRREARRRRAMQARAQQNDRRSPTQRNDNYNDFSNRY
ncbi:MAG: TPM domain-containing protein [Clostridia bacterium]|nr:TPM domain-containing protein [Clostridia bacterium]